MSRHVAWAVWLSIITLLGTARAMTARDDPPPAAEPECAALIQLGVLTTAAEAASMSLKNAGSAEIETNIIYLRVAARTFLGTTHCNLPTATPADALLINYQRALVHSNTILSSLLQDLESTRVRKKFWRRRKINVTNWPTIYATIETVKAARLRIRRLIDLFEHHDMRRMKRWEPSPHQALVSECSRRGGELLDALSTLAGNVQLVIDIPGTMTFEQISGLISSVVLLLGDFHTHTLLTLDVIFRPAESEPVNFIEFSELSLFYLLYEESYAHPVGQICQALTASQLKQEDRLALAKLVVWIVSHPLWLLRGQRSLLEWPLQVLETLMREDAAVPDPLPLLKEMRQIVTSNAEVNFDNPQARDRAEDQGERIMHILSKLTEYGPFYLSGHLNFGLGTAAYDFCHYVEENCFNLRATIGVASPLVEASLGQVLRIYSVPPEPYPSAPRLKIITIIEALKGYSIALQGEMRKHDLPAIAKWLFAKSQTPRAMPDALIKTITSTASASAKSWCAISVLAAGMLKAAQEYQRYLPVSDIMEYRVIIAPMQAMAKFELIVNTALFQALDLKDQLESAKVYYTLKAASITVGTILGSLMANVSPLIPNIWTLIVRQGPPILESNYYPELLPLGSPVAPPTGLSLLASDSIPPNPVLGMSSTLGSFYQP